MKDRQNMHTSNFFRNVPINNISYVQKLPNCKIERNTVFWKFYRSITPSIFKMSIFIGVIIKLIMSAVCLLEVMKVNNWNHLKAGEDFNNNPFFQSIIKKTDEIWSDLISAQCSLNSRPLKEPLSVSRKLTSLNYIKPKLENILLIRWWIY